MKEQILTDNRLEKITALWDGKQFGLVRKRRNSPALSVMIILNPREMQDLVKFAEEALKKG